MPSSGISCSGNLPSQGLSNAEGEERVVGAMQHHGGHREGAQLFTPSLARIGERHVARTGGHVGRTIDDPGHPRPRVCCIEVARTSQHVGVLYAVLDHRRAVGPGLRRSSPEVRSRRLRGGDRTGPPRTGLRCSATGPWAGSGPRKWTRTGLKDWNTLIGATTDISRTGIVDACGAGGQGLPVRAARLGGGPLGPTITVSDSFGDRLTFLETAAEA